MAKWSSRAAARELAGADPALARVIEAVGPPRLRRPLGGPHGHFAALARSIVFQQLAGAAAATIWRRVGEAVGEVTPAGVLGVSDDRLRSAGLSRAKLASLTDLARAVTDGRLDLGHVARQSDSEIHEALVGVRGIGPWTADMFLLFQLRRPDVWPTGDLGVRRGYALVHGLAGDPTPAELLEWGAPYQPWRSVAAWYMWRAVDTITPERG
jgi:3-methyladenine DNA glycosylase/8-oxoguanine DNA glycosylase